MLWHNISSSFNFQQYENICFLSNSRLTFILLSLKKNLNFSSIKIYFYINIIKIYFSSIKKILIFLLLKYIFLLLKKILMCECVQRWSSLKVRLNRHKDWVFRVCKHKQGIFNILWDPFRSHWLFFFIKVA